MVNAFKNKTSKRMTCHKKYKIRKKVREHNKKLAKNLKNTFGQKKKQSGAVPNMAPFKEELLLEAVKQKQQKDEDKLIKKKTKTPKIITPKPKPTETNAPVRAVGAQALSAEAVIAKSDILLYVVDIRSVGECRDLDLEAKLKESEKPFIFILNRIDGVTPAVVKKWYSYLSTISHTHIMKSTQVLLSDCEQILPTLKQIVARFFGGKQLVAELRSRFSKTAENEARIGVIGAKGVGKSSVISTILKSCGRTKAKQSSETKLGDKMKLITTPGLIQDAPQNGILGMLLDITRYMNVAPTVVINLSQFFTPEQAMVYFSLSEYKQQDQLLTMLANRYNMMYNKEPDEQAVCRFILKQLRDGKIKFCVQAPQAVQLEIPEELKSGLEQYTFSGDMLHLSGTDLSLEGVLDRPKKGEAESDGEEMEGEEDDEEKWEDASGSEEEMAE